MADIRHGECRFPYQNYLTMRTLAGGAVRRGNERDGGNCRSFLVLKFVPIVEIRACYRDEEPGIQGFLDGEGETGNLF
jgi:hypothetical protein